MSSNGKMVLFFIGATLFNIIVMILMIAIFILVIGWVLGADPNPTTFQILVFVAFIGSIVLTFLLYGRVMKWVTVKWQLEKNIPQLFKGKKK
jgi:membrane protein YdbS with pleckstrin-like domain